MQQQTQLTVNGTVYLLQ